MTGLSRLVLGLLCSIVLGIAPAAWSAAAWAQTAPTQTAPTQTAPAPTVPNTPAVTKPAPATRAAKPTAFRRQYTVFFSQDSASLMPSATHIIRVAAEAAKQRRFSHLKVTAYSDAPGPPAAAKTLSQARAAAIREALVAAGIPGDKIRIEGRGKFNSAVGTTNSELRNRRARIVLYLPGE